MNGIGQKILLWILLWLGCCPAGNVALAQDEVDDDLFESEFMFLDVQAKLVTYSTQINELKQNIPSASRDELEGIRKEMERVDVKWNIYNQSKQEMITGSDSLMQLVANYQVYKQETQDSLNVRMHYFDSADAFDKAETFIFAQDEAYADFDKKSTELALVKQTAPLLEKLKVKEQLLFAEITKHYEQAKTAAGEFADLTSRFAQLEEKYIDLTNLSGKIQAREFKPFFQRIKDYLMGLAAVTMILMFVSMVTAKIKVLKQARDNAKKMKDMLQQNNNTDYPTI